MAISLPASQATRAARAALRPITLVQIDVTVPAAVTWRFSTDTRIFSSNEYRGLLVSVGRVVQQMTHLGNVPFSDEVSFTLRNEGEDGSTLLDEMMVGALEGSRVTISQVLLSDTELNIRPSTTDKVDRFVGVVRSVSEVRDQEFTIRCVDDYVDFDNAIDWYRITDSDGVPEGEVGRKIPKVYGASVEVRPIEWRGSGFTTLAEDIDDAKTGAVKLTDISSFAPSGSRKLKIGQEIVNATNPNPAANTFNFQTRGDDASTAILHKRGETVLEVTGDPSEYICMDGADNRGIDRVFYIAGNGEKVDVTDKVTSFDLADTAKIPGRTVASFRINKSQLKGLKEVDEILQQPESPVTVEEIDMSEDVTVASDAGTEAMVNVGGLFGETPAMQSTTLGGWNVLRRYWVLGKDDQKIVLRFRLGVIMVQLGYASGTGRIDTVSSRMRGPGGGTASVILSWTGDAIKNGQSAWVNLPAGTTMNDFVNPAKSTLLPHFRAEFDSDDDGQFNLDTVLFQYQKISIELEISGQLATETAAFGGTFSPEFVAECSGRKVPAADATYQVAAGVLIEKDADVARHVLQEQLGGKAVTLSADWNAEAALEGTDVDHRLVLNDLGERLSEVLPRLADESRANILLDTGTWRFLRRLSSYAAAGAELGKNEFVRGESPRVAFRSLEKIQNKGEAFFDRDRLVSGSGEETFRSQVPASDNASITRFGERSESPIEYLTIGKTAVATASLQEFIQERAGRRRRVELVLPYWAGYAMQRGDVVPVILPRTASAGNFRILEIERDLTSDNRMTIRTFEVIGVVSRTIETKYGVIGPLSVTKGTAYGVIGLVTVTKGTAYGVVRPDADQWDQATPDWDDVGATYD